jgi:hypothetical protein
MIAGLWSDLVRYPRHAPLPGFFIYLLAVVAIQKRRGGQSYPPSRSRPVARGGATGAHRHGVGAGLGMARGGMGSLPTPFASVNNAPRLVRRRSHLRHAKRTISKGTVGETRYLSSGDDRRRHDLLAIRSPPVRRSGSHRSAPIPLNALSPILSGSHFLRNLEPSPGV